MGECATCVTCKVLTVPIFPLIHGIELSANEMRFSICNLPTREVEPLYSLGQNALG